MGIVQLKEGKIPFPSGEVLGSEQTRARYFAENFPNYCDKLKKFFSIYRQSKDKIALFGAGHLACTFVNLFKLKEFIDFCVDDNPNKRGLFLPGSHLPIYGSSSLIKEKVKLCILGLNPLNEDKVIRINQDFINQGGTFLSIFPMSERALYTSDVWKERMNYANQQI